MTAPRAAAAPECALLAAIVATMLAVTTGSSNVFGQNPQAEDRQRPVRLYLVSLGVASGPAFRALTINDRADMIRLLSDGLIVEPVRLDAGTLERLRSEIGATGENAVTHEPLAYCVEFEKEPPSEGTIFRVAGPAEQERYADLRRILRAGRQAREAGLLRPDSDPEGYYHFIRQWAIWAAQRELDQAGFTREWLDRTRRNFRAEGRSWTEEMEELVRGLAPGRWRDIARILGDAGSHSIEGDAR